MAEPINISVVQGVPGRSQFTFDGGAASYVGTQILAALITVLSFGLLYPYALVLTQRWRCSHSMIDGRRLVFTGTGLGLFGLWVKWFFLIIFTLGMYSFWVVPRLNKWVWEHTNFA